MRLIDADLLSEDIKRGAGTDIQKFFADVCIAAAPTVDAVPVVYCKDCKHLYGTICAVCGLLPRNPNEFCSRGERKDRANGI